MATIYINARCQKIVNLLLMGEDYISLKEIAEETGVSKRSIYYDLCKINEWLDYYEIDEIEVIRGKGILISNSNKKKIAAIVENESGEESYIFSPTERAKIIYCYIMIMHLSHPVYIDQIAEYCQVSRNTIFNDLKVVVNQLQEYNLSLAYEPKKGYWITGDVIRIRAMLFMNFTALLPLFRSGVLDFIKAEPIDEYLEKLEKIEQELNTDYVDGVLLALATLTPLMYRGRRRPHFENLKKEGVTNTEEYRLVSQYFPDLPEEEQIYMSLHLLGSRVTVSTDDMFDTDSDQSVYEITKALILEFEKRACVIFEDREELERSLFIHISTSLYRYQYGIQIGNPMTDDIMREYQSLFDITKVVSRYLEQLVGLPIPDSEIAYLALHFGAHLRVSTENEQKNQILVVCPNGISAGNMLKREVQKLLPYAKKIELTADPDIEHVDKYYDLVITTVKVNSQLPTIMVHPILTDLDRNAILNHHVTQQKQQENHSLAIFQIVKKYIKEADYSDVKMELERYFHEGKRASEKKSDGLGLMQFLKRDRLEIVEGEYSWQDGIKLAGKKLLEEKSIEKRYIDNILSQIRFYGPFMLVAPGIFLAHGKPEDGVKKLDVSMTVFRNPIRFSEFQQASVVITLATEDQEKHLHILKDIMTIFEEDSNGIEEIQKRSSVEEMLQYMEEVLA